MGKFEIQKLEELEYDEIVTLGVIESDEDLTSIFRDKISLSFKILHSIAKQSKFNDDTKSMLYAIFNSIILTKREYITKYKELMISGHIDKPLVEPVGVVSKKTTIKKVIKKENKQPRRYGKDKIMVDVENQGGKITSLQRAMLSNNATKNIGINLTRKLIHDMTSERKILTDEDYRIIEATNRLVETRLKHILKKK